MDIRKRLLRRPVRTVLWQIMLIAMSLLIGVSSVLVYSSNRLTTVLDEHQTTIATQQLNIQKIGPSEWRSYPVRLYQEDIDAIKAMDMVKDVDLRTLTGAYIPELSARIGLINRYGMNLENVDFMAEWLANAAYQKVILAGTVEQAWMTSHNSIMDYDLSAVGGPELVEGYSHRALINIEQIIVAHGDYEFFPSEEYTGYNGKIIVEYPCFYTEDDEKYNKNFFEVGEAYVLRGDFDPGTFTRDGDISTVPFSTRLDSGMISLQGMNYALIEGNQLAIYTEYEPDRSPFDESGVEGILSYGGDRRVLAEKVVTTVEDVLNSDEWQKIISLYDQTLHAFPVIGTEYLESMYCFLKNEASIVSGRTFTQAEYDNGEKVCVISESVATNGGIQVGDTITFNQFHVPADYATGNESLDHGTDGTLNNPSIGYEPIPYGFETENETFTVVGIYRLENEWENSAYSITPNTIFVPQKAQIPGGFGGASYEHEVVRTQWVSYDDGEWIQETGPVIEIFDNGVLGVFMSIILENGRMADFEEAIKETDYADRIFLTFDQGYEAAQESVLSVIAMANKLFGFASAGWILLLLLYILLGQSPERKNLGIMRSVGAKPKQTRRYLFLSGLLPAVIGVAVGTVLSNTVAKLAQDKLVSLTLTQAQSSAHSGGIPLNNSALAGMLAESTLSLQGILLLAAVQISVIGVLLWLHAAYLARKKPRKLLGA